MRLRPTVEADLDFVLAAEADPEVAPFVLSWPRERHLQAIGDADEKHLMLVDGERPLGFVILAGLSSELYGIELRRIVVAERGRGTGQAALALVLDRVFADLGAHRVWLDVVTGNARARRAYLGAGFVEEGVLRDAFKTDDGYESLVVMSVLAGEHAAAAGHPKP